MLTLPRCVFASLALSPSSCSIAHSPKTPGVASAHLILVGYPSTNILGKREEGGVDCVSVLFFLFLAHKLVATRCLKRAHTHTHNYPTCGFVVTPVLKASTPDPSHVALGRQGNGCRRRSFRCFVQPSTREGTAKKVTTSSQPDLAPRWILSQREEEETHTTRLPS